MILYASRFEGSDIEFRINQNTIAGFLKHIHQAIFSLSILEEDSISFFDISSTFITCSRFTPSKSSMKDSIESPVVK